MSQCTQHGEKSNMYQILQHFSEDLLKQLQLRNLHLFPALLILYCVLVSNSSVEQSIGVILKFIEHFRRLSGWHQIKRYINCLGSNMTLVWLLFVLKNIKQNFITTSIPSLVSLISSNQKKKVTIVTKNKYNLKIHQPQNLIPLHIANAPSC